MLAFLRAYEGERYDVALALDIVEHFEPEQGVELVVLALEAADFVVLTTPKRFYAQRWESNPLENHLSWWPRSALSELARRAGAQASIAQTLDTNIAVLSRRAQPPSIETQRVRAVIGTLRDRLVPELAWYRLRGKSGPTL